MSTASRQDFAGQLRAQPGKAGLLAVLALGALWTWTRLAFGGDEREAAPAPPPAPVPAPAATPAAPPGPAIRDFTTATARIEQWREALAREDLTPPEEIAVPEELAADLFAPGAPAVEEAPPPAEELPELTGTAILGRVRFAVFGRERVQAGGRIGRYEVAEVRPREVLLTDGRRRLVLSLDAPGAVRSDHPADHPTDHQEP